MITNGAASTRDKTISRYSALARTALQGGAITDCEPGAFDNGCFGAASPSPTCGPARRFWTWDRVAALTCCSLPGA